MRSRSEGKASRIYAGCDPLPPVNPLVPFALIPVLVGVDIVRTFCAQHAYGFYGSGPRVEYLERGILWLFAGAAACVLAIVFSWWRGRREWGDVPLGFGIGGCTFAYVLSAWFGFTHESEINSGDMNTFFIGPVLFGVLLLFLTYLVLELVARGSAGPRAVIALVAIPIVLFLSVGPVVVTLGKYEDNRDPAYIKLDHSSLDFAWLGHWNLWRGPFQSALPDENGIFLYGEHEGRLVAATEGRVRRGQVFAKRLAYLDSKFVEMEPGPRSSLVVYGDPENDGPSFKYLWIYDHIPDAVVSLTASSPADRLHRIAGDLKRRVPDADDLHLGCWKTTFPARYQGSEFSKSWYSKSAILEFRLSYDRPAWEVHVMRIDGEVRLELLDKPWPLIAVLNGAARKAEIGSTRMGSWPEYDEDLLPPLRLRIHSDVSVQEFADAVVELRESTYPGWWFSMVIEDWQPEAESADSR
jgi:hypothetical protein